jgi:hypothetical protein
MGVVMIHHGFSSPISPQAKLSWEPEFCLHGLCKRLVAKYQVAAFLVETSRPETEGYLYQISGRGYGSGTASR